MTTCTLCPYPHFAKGYCQMHYRRWCKNGDPLVQGRIHQTRRTVPPEPTPAIAKIPRTCTRCDAPHLAHGLCSKHYQRYKHGDLATNKELPMPAKHQPPMQPTLANLLTAYKAQGRGSISIDGPLAGQRVLLSLLVVKDRMGGNLSHTELRAFADRGSCVIQEPWLREIASRIGLTIETTASSPNMLTARGQLTAKEEAA